MGQSHFCCHRLETVSPLRHVPIQLSIGPWAHTLLQECCIHGLPFSPWSRCWRLLLRPKQQVDVVRHGAGHGSPRLLLLVHHPLPPQHHRLLGLLVHVQDGEVQLQCELYQCRPTPQGEPPRLNVQEHEGGRLRDPPHQLRPLFLILRQRPTLQECRLQLLIQHLTSFNEQSLPKNILFIHKHRLSCSV